MLKVGDKIISLVDLIFLGDVIVSKGTIGMIKEKDKFCSLVTWEEGMKNDFGKTEWWIDSEDIKVIGDDDMYNIEKEKQFLINKGYNVDKHIKQAKEFYKENYLKDVEYEIDVDDVIFVRNEKETVIGHIDCISKEWLKEILLNVLEQRNDLQDEIVDLKLEIEDIQEDKNTLIETLNDIRGGF